MVNSQSQLELEKLFHNDMINIYKNGKKIGYNALIFLQMINTQKGIHVAKKLIHSNKPSEGFTNLYLKGGLDGLALTVEALILKEEYISLFSEDERKTARERLKEYGFETSNAQIENELEEHIEASSIRIHEPDKNKSKFNEFNYELFIKRLQNQEYQIGEIRKYYIITVKVEMENTLPKYLVYLLENNEIINRIEVQSEVTMKLLTTAKKEGIILLHQQNPLVKIEDVAMVHYKQGRQNSSDWQKDNKDVLVVLFEEYQSILKDAILKVSSDDIDSEMSEEDEYYKDGATKTYHGKRYERNPNNRAKAIKHHGLDCAVCGFNFEKSYGERGADFIEVHHVNLLSTLKEEVLINPEVDLMPVCANCHRMIHRRKDNVLTIDELKGIFIALRSKMETEISN